MLKGLASLSLSLVFLSSGTIVLAAESGYVARSNLMQNIRSEFSVLARMAQEKIQFDESLAESTRLTLLNLAASAPTIFEDNELPINSEALIASFSLFISPFDPGTVGTPKSLIIFFASILSPIISI